MGGGLAPPSVPKPPFASSNLQGLVAHGNQQLKAGGGGEGTPFSLFLLLDVVVVLISQKYQAWLSLWDCLEFSMINSLLLLGRWKLLISSISPPVGMVFLPFVLVYIVQNCFDD